MQSMIPFLNIKTKSVTTALANGQQQQHYHSKQLLHSYVLLEFDGSLSQMIDLPTSVVHMFW